MGRTLIYLGAILIAAGLLVSLGERFHIRIGRLPGDILIRGKNSVLYFPLMTCSLVSLVLSLVIWLVNRFR